MVIILCLIMLDFIIHYCKKTLKLINDTKNYFIFTPSYSPNNNPIETIFSIIKNKFKKIIKTTKNIKMKSLIIITINKTISDKEIGKENYKDIFIRSINYDYKNIEKELRDRITIKK